MAYQDEEFVAQAMPMEEDPDGEYFESQRSPEQKLRFQAAQAEFSRRKVAFGPKQMRPLKLIDPDGFYTNLALLLSDQCPYTNKVALYQGTDQRQCQEVREYFGSIFEQMNAIYQFLQEQNQTTEGRDDLLSIERKAYSEMALREAFINFLVHRNYAAQGTSQINVYEDRMEFISIGGLLTSIELDDIMVDASFCRNYALADIFYQLMLIETNGIGIARIRDAYQDLVVQPRIRLTKKTFTMILPRCQVKVR